MLSITISNGLALIPELIEEQESAQAEPADERGQTEEGQGGDAAEGELRHRVVGSAVEAVAVVAREHEMGEDRDDDGESEEDEPGEADGPRVGLIDAEPSEPRAEALELVLGVGGAPGEGPGLARIVEQGFSCVPHGCITTANL